MKANISSILLGVQDMDRSKRFYPRPDSSDTRKNRP
jgi:hypothetical protein